MNGLLERARHLHDLGRHAEAREVLHRHLSGEPEDDEALELLARVEFADGDGAACVAAATSAIAVAPERDSAYRALALGLDKLGRHDEAVSAANASVVLAPQEPYSHIIYALVALETPQLVPVARQAAEESRRLAPHLAETHFALGVVLQHQRRWKDAEQCYRQTLALDPNHAMAINNLTTMQGGFRKHRKQLDGYTAALAVDPSMGVAQENVAALSHLFARRIFFAGIAGFLATALASNLRGGPDSVTWLIGGLSVLVTLGWAWWTVHDVSVGVRHFVGRQLRTDRLLGVAVILAVATLLATVAVAVLDLDGESIGRIIQVVGFANVGYVIAVALKNRE